MQKTRYTNKRAEILFLFNIFSNASFLVKKIVTEDSIFTWNVDTVT